MAPTDLDHVRLHFALAPGDEVALLALVVLALLLVHVVHVLLHVVLPDRLVVAELAVVHPHVHLMHYKLTGLD